MPVLKPMWERKAQAARMEKDFVFTIKIVCHKFKVIQLTPDRRGIIKLQQQQRSKTKINEKRKTT